MQPRGGLVFSRMLNETIGPTMWFIGPFTGNPCLTSEDEKFLCVVYLWRRRTPASLIEFILQLTRRKHQSDLLFVSLEQAT